MYHDHESEYFDEGPVNTHEEGFDGNDGAGLKEKGVKGAIVEATELLLQFSRESSKFNVKKGFKYLHHFSMNAEDYRTNFQNYEMCETVAGKHARGRLTALNFKKKIISHKCSGQDSELIF